MGRKWKASELPEHGVRCQTRMAWGKAIYSTEAINAPCATSEPSSTPSRMTPSDGARTSASTLLTHAAQGVVAVTL